MLLSEITPLILTLNEAPNLRATLDALQWAKQIVIVDSGSTDETLSIAAEYPQVTVYHREFDHFADQCNFGLAKITTPWTLSLDADYRCPPELPTELKALDGTAAGYRAAFRYCIYGKPLGRSLYPPRVVLYRTESAQYQHDGHAHKVRITGPIGELQSRILHDDRKPLGPWFAAQLKYAELEAAKILNTPTAQLHWKDRLRRHIVLAPPLTLCYCLFAQGLILDGWPGVYYALQRTIAEVVLSLVILDGRLRR